LIRIKEHDPFSWRHHPMSRTLPIAMVLVVAATAARAADPPPHGEALLQRHCSGCHAVGRTGDSPKPPAPPLRELHRRYDPEILGEALSEGLLTGHPLMPEFRFEPDEVRAIIRYLDSIQTRQPA
jgi:mono/diheme cytochrome c family protein